MSSISVKLEGRNGDYLKTLPVPASQSDAQRMGAIDGAIIAFFLVCASGLIFMLLMGQ